MKFPNFRDFHTDKSLKNNKWMCNNTVMRQQVSQHMHTFPNLPLMKMDQIECSTWKTTRINHSPGGKLHLS